MPELNTKIIQLKEQAPLKFSLVKNLYRDVLHRFNQAKNAFSSQASSIEVYAAKEFTQLLNDEHRIGLELHEIALLAEQCKGHLDFDTLFNETLDEDTLAGNLEVENAFWKTVENRIFSLQAPTEPLGAESPLEPSVGGASEYGYFGPKNQQRRSAQQVSINDGNRTVQACPPAPRVYKYVTLEEVKFSSPPVSPTSF